MKEKKDVRGEICKIISKMLDNPDKYGIYPTTICYDELETLIKEVEEETRGDVLNKLHAMVCDLTTDKGKDLAKEDCLELIRYQIERIYGKKLLSITNKDKQNETRL